MGRRDQPELGPSEDELAEAEGALRHTLARYGEPAPVAPPPGLAARVIAALPAAAPAPPQHATAGPSRLRLGARLALAGALALLVALGAWGVLVNSLVPASVAGGPAAGAGQLLLVLTLAAKPLVNLLASAGATAALLAVVAIGGAWLWWRIVSTTPFASPVEIRR